MKLPDRLNPIPALRRCAFTLFELLVVMVIIIALIAITLPSFAAMLESAAFSSAVNSVTGTLGNARALAISSSKPVGVAFLFDAEDEEYTLMLVELARSGTAGVLTPGVSDGGRTAWALRPAQNTTPVTLPQGTGVFGMSFNHVASELSSGVSSPEEAARDGVAPPLIDQNAERWFAGELFPDPDNPQRLFNPWLFPRNDARLFIDPEDLDPAKRRFGVTEDELWLRVHDIEVDGVDVEPERAARAVRNAHSFLVIFGSDGTVKGMHDGDGNAVEYDFYIEFPDDPVDNTNADQRRPEPYDHPFTFDPESVGERAGVEVEQPAPNPEVLLRSVDQLAIVSFNRLTAGLTEAEATAQAGIDRFWELHPSTSAPTLRADLWPDFRGGAAFRNDPLPHDDEDLDKFVREVSLWIDQNAEILGFDRYSGAVQRRRQTQ